MYTVYTMCPVDAVLPVHTVDRIDPVETVAPMHQVDGRVIVGLNKFSTLPESVVV